MHVWITSRIFGKEESRQVCFYTFQMIQAAKDLHGVSTGNVDRESFSEAALV